MSDRPVIEIYDAQGRRLYTLQQFAELEGIAPGTLRVRWHREQVPDPAGWVDERTAVWHHPKPPAAAPND